MSKSTANFQTAPRDYNNNTQTVKDVNNCSDGSINSDSLKGSGNWGAGRVTKSFISMASRNSGGINQAQSAHNNFLNTINHTHQNMDLSVSLASTMMQQDVPFIQHAYTGAESSQL